MATSPDRTMPIFSPAGGKSVTVLRRTLAQSIPMTRRPEPDGRRIGSRICGVSPNESEHSNGTSPHAPKRVTRVANHHSDIGCRISGARRVLRKYSTVCYSNLVWTGGRKTLSTRLRRKRHAAGVGTRYRGVRRGDACGWISAGKVGFPSFHELPFRGCLRNSAEDRGYRRKDRMPARDLRTSYSGPMERRPRTQQAGIKRHDSARILHPRGFSKGANWASGRR
jgi:hypothetical protein